MSGSAAVVTPESFKELIASFTRQIQGRALDETLELELNRLFPVDGAESQALFAACRSGIASGWMCTREAGGIRFGRIVNPGNDTHGFSVDVVDMQPAAGPHHRHPNGEIDFVMPIDAQAQFDGRGAGWLVYGAGSDHRPTVTRGRTLVLYLLPAGAIEFTGR